MMSQLLVNKFGKYCDGWDNDHSCRRVNWFCIQV